MQNPSNQRSSFKHMAFRHMLFNTLTLEHIHLSIRRSSEFRLGKVLKLQARLQALSQALSRCSQIAAACRLIKEDCRSDLVLQTNAHVLNAGESRDPLPMLPQN